MCRRRRSGCWFRLGMLGAPGGNGGIELRADAFLLALIVLNALLDQAKGGRIVLDLLQTHQAHKAFLIHVREAKKGDYVETVFRELLCGCRCAVNDEGRIRLHTLIRRLRQRGRAKGKR